MDALILSCAVDGNDAGVALAAGGLSFALELLERLGGELHVGLEHLERYSTPQRALLGLVDHTHAAAAELANQAKIPSSLTKGTVSPPSPRSPSPAPQVSFPLAAGSSAGNPSATIRKASIRSMSSLAKGACWQR